MAEVLKNKKKVKYDIDKMNDLKVETKKDNKNKQPKKKNEKKVDNSKKSFADRWKSFWYGVRNEIKIIHWPTKEKMIKYSVITILFVIFLAIFFYFIDVIFAFVQSLFN